MGPTEVVRWKSKDGLEIEGLLTYPAGYEKGKRYPLAAQCSRRTDGRLHADLRRRARPVSDRRFQRARLCGPASEPARLERLWQKVPLCQLQATGAAAIIKTS